MAHRSRLPTENAADPDKFRKADEVVFSAATTGEPAVTRCIHAGKIKRHKNLSYIGPTVYWLTHGALNNIVARFERFGAVRVVEDMVQADVDGLKARYMSSHDAYTQQVLAPLSDEARTFFVDHYSGPDAKGRKYGNAAVGDPLTVKCLHAQVASSLAGVPNPIGCAIVRYICAMRAVLAQRYEGMAKGRGAANQSTDGKGNSATNEAAVAAPSTSGGMPPAPSVGEGSTAVISLDVSDDFDRNFKSFVASVGPAVWSFEGVDLAAPAFDVCGASMTLAVHFDGHAPSMKKKHRVN
jgi:hypothetical protein